MRHKTNHTLRLAVAALALFLLLLLSPAPAARADSVVILPDQPAPEVIGYWQYYDPATCQVVIVRLYSNWQWEEERYGGPCN